MWARVVVGEEEKNGGLWCSPSAKTSSPTSSAFLAIATIALIRSASLGVRPVVGSVVTSLTEKIPNCISSSKWMTCHVVGINVHDVSFIPRKGRLEERDYAHRRPPAWAGADRGVARRRGLSGRCDRDGPGPGGGPWAAAAPAAARHCTRRPGRT